MLTTQLLITKVFLSRCAQEKPSAAAARKAAASRLAGGLPDDGPPIRREDYNSFASVYRAAGTDPKQRRWFVFEPALVLPEYLVEVEYLPAKRPPEREPSAAQLAPMAHGSVLSMCWVKFPKKLGCGQAKHTPTRRDHPGASSSLPLSGATARLRGMSTSRSCVHGSLGDARA